MEIKSTDREDFKVIYDLNYSVVMQVIMHIVYNQEIAEDLTQETFERFYLQNKTFPDEDQAKYWLLRVAKNLALNHLRRNKREIQMIEKVKNLPGNGIDTPDVSKRIVEDETKREVRRAIEALPEKLRYVILLKEYTDLDYKGISEVLNISETNVKVRVFRARKELQELLSREEGDVY